jgi:hypothetical protein
MYREREQERVSESERDRDKDREREGERERERLFVSYAVAGHAYTLQTSVATVKNFSVMEEYNA